MKQPRHLTIAAVGLAAILFSGLLLGAFAYQARANTASDILKIGGVLLVVNNFGKDIDHAINGLLKQRKAEQKRATKVVPIFSVGQGAYIGAAQVVGLPARTQKVQVVAAVEGVVGKVHGTLLVPISTKLPGSKLARVDGVGVSAIIDLKL